MKNQLVWVLNHFGHTLDVHKIHYRQTSSVIERVEIAKILLLQDYGRVQDFHNKKLSDIQLTELIEPEDDDKKSHTQTNVTDRLDAQLLIWIPFQLSQNNTISKYLSVLSCIYVSRDHGLYLSFCLLM